MAKFVLSHSHEPHECAVVFAAWRGFDSPLRRETTLGSCASGDHRLWWTVEAGDKQQALDHLPPFVARRTEVTEVADVPIP